MDVLELIYSRRSIRKFTGEVINEIELEKIIKAGFAAPSAHNKQPWEFVVIKEQETLKTIAESHPYAKMLPSAGSGILVCGNKNVQEIEGFLVSDCSGAIENMLLASHALNLGAVWVGIYPIPDLIQMMENILKIPGHIIPIGLVVVGHKEQNKEPWNRYDKAKVHYNKW